MFEFIIHCKHEIIVSSRCVGILYINYKQYIYFYLQKKLENVINVGRYTYSSFFNVMYLIIIIYY